MRFCFPWRPGRELCPTAAPGISSPGDTKPDAQEPPQAPPRLHFGHPHFLQGLVSLPGQYPKVLAVEICVSPTGVPLKPFSLLCGCFTSTLPAITPELQGPAVVCREQPVPFHPWLWVFSGVFYSDIFQFHPFSASFTPSFTPGQPVDGGAQRKGCRGFTAAFNSQGPGTETCLPLHKSIIFFAHSQCLWQ